jgi:recombinational DNA repair ATPase RecF
MITVESITIKEFRGIRDLTLELEGKNFAVCGPNGSGKSGIVDALEFALTGGVSRLAGEARGEVSLRQHGPHVDVRGDPAKACVSVTVRIPSLNKTATIARNAKSPAVAQVTPRDPDILEVLEQLEAHPELVLSRRELIRYVLATPGTRAQEVQALLHLGQVERVRAGLLKLANDSVKQLGPLRSAGTQARDNLLRALQVPEITTDAVLAVANTRRAVLGLPALDEIVEGSSLKAGIATPAPAQTQSIPKAQALADLAAARELLGLLESDATRTIVADVRRDLSTLATDPAVSEAVSWEAFYSAGIRLLRAEECPFCDTPWSAGTLRAHVRAKLEHLNAVTAQRRAIEEALAPVVASLETAHMSLSVLVQYGALTAPPVPMQDVIEHFLGCRTAATQLRAFVPLAQTSALLEAVPNVPATVLAALRSLEAALNALPEPNAQDAAKEWLTLAQERFDVWGKTQRALEDGEARAQSTRQISDLYAATSDAVLAGLYAAVEKDFESLYRIIHNDDERTFAAKLVPATGKLSFDVDFYGRGFFPPNAYHSEGHQDSMGLCLYLALMRYLNGPRFTVAVLDDVLMSVDSGHRRHVCTLLKKEFPNTQFIVTTHDPVWLRHMKTAGLIGGRSAIQFSNWSVDLGPTQWNDRDIWAEISNHLTRNDVRAAAALLRHYLEYVSAELCHYLRAPVQFRGDGQYELGELLPPAIARLRSLYGKGTDAASSWNQRELVGQLRERATAFGQVADASAAEQWQVNVAVHYNSWENLQKTDFEPVVVSFQQLLAGFACSDCGDYLRVSPDRETAESLRCDCGKTNITLLRKA